MGVIRMIRQLLGKEIEEPLINNTITDHTEQVTETVEVPLKQIELIEVIAPTIEEPDSKEPTVESTEPIATAEEPTIEVIQPSDEESANELVNPEQTVESPETTEYSPKPITWAWKNW